MLRRQAKSAPAAPLGQSAAGGRTALFVPVHLELEVDQGTHTITNSGQPLTTIQVSSPQRLDIVTIVRFDEWAGPDAIAVEAPNRVLGASLEPPEPSGEVRPFEDDDVVSQADATAVGLGQGWAPREFVDGGPVRWIGHRADIHISPEATGRTLSVSGIAGPCLGRNAEVVLFEGSHRLDSVAIDIEDGQDFRASLSLKRRASGAGVVTMQVERPRPRYTPHDVRVLNLLITKVGIR